MPAHAGDWLIVKGRTDSSAARRAMVLEAHGPNGSAPFLVRWIDSGHGAARVEAWRRLQRRLARFTGDNLAHMDHEETANNAVLHACYTDGELIALHQQILASLSPQELATGLRWVLTGSSPAERTQVMAGIRADAPPPVFEAMLDMARQSLAASAWNKLAVSLAPARIAA